jgi:hypothetical protein
MRHFVFAVLTVLALLIAAPGALVFAMNECQLHGTQAAADECFRNAGGAETLWPAAVVGFLVLSVALHLVGSRWKFAGLAALAIGPWLVLMV